MAKGEGMTLGQIQEELKDEMQGKVEVERVDLSKALTEMSPWRMQVEGDYGAGKSHAIASAIKYICERFTPEQVRIWVVDCDGTGLIPILNMLLDPKYAGSVKLFPVRTDEERLAIREATHIITDAVADIRQHIAAGNPPEACWVMLDNMKEIWQSAQDFFSRVVYGTALTERMLLKRQSAAQEGKKTLPTFVQLTDFAFINRDHDFYIAHKLRDAGVNFMWTAPLKEVDIEVDGRKEKVTRNEGKKDLHAKVDWVLRLRYSGGSRKAELYKSRWVRLKFKDVEDIDFGKFIDLVNAIIAQEKGMEIRPKDSQVPLPFLGEGNKDSSPTLKPSVVAKVPPQGEDLSVPAEEPASEQGGDPWESL